MITEARAEDNWRKYCYHQGALSMCETMVGILLAGQEAP
jgi:hypothetical protein